MNERYALLDADFISKLHITRKDEENRLIDRMLELPGFTFYCHQQIAIELAKHNSTASSWLLWARQEGKINIYTDERLLQGQIDIFGNIAYLKYVIALRNSCDLFSASLFDRYYAPLEEYLVERGDNYELLPFCQMIIACDQNIGVDNNLGEIKSYMMAQLLNDESAITLSVFCSDDRRARNSIAAIGSFSCVSAIASFYLVRKYLDMSREEAMLYFDSWMRLHEKVQTCFRVQNSRPEHQLVKMDGYDIFDRIYRGTLVLAKNGELMELDEAN